MENTEILTNNSTAFIPVKTRCVTLDECSVDWLNSLEGKAKITAILQRGDRIMCCRTRCTCG